MEALPRAIARYRELVADLGRSIRSILWRTASDCARLRISMMTEGNPRLSLSKSNEVRANEPLDCCASSTTCLRDHHVCSVRTYS